MQYPQEFILHVDLDCFFAAVYLLDHPEHIGLPIIVGADPKKGKGRGVVSTCSYEAREYGIHSAMPISHAYQRCPNGIYVHSNFDRIKAISHHVMDILRQKSKFVEQTSIDEAYLDCTYLCKTFQEAYEIAVNLKDTVKAETGVTCSVGVSFSKTLAKIGSDCNKPNGVTLLTPKNYQNLLKNLKITRIPGIGKKTKFFYQKRGYFLIGDLYSKSLPVVRAQLGEHGVWAWYAAHGLDKRKVHGEPGKHVPKSISKERTFSEDITDMKIVISKIEQLNQKLHKQMIKHSLYYKTITIKIRFHGFDTFTRSFSFLNPIRHEKKAMSIAMELLAEFYKNEKKVRLIGLKFSNFAPLLPSRQKKITEFINSSN